MFIINYYYHHQNQNIFIIIIINNCYYLSLVLYSLYTTCSLFNLFLNQ